MQVMVGSRARWARRTVAAVAALGLGTALSGCATPRWQSELASVNGAGTGSGNDLSWRPNVSRDGTKVVFESEASDLGPADANGVSDIYMRDLTTGTTQLISRSASGSGAGDGPSTGPEFSADGSKVFFSSEATDLSETRTGGVHPDLYVHDLATGVTDLVSVAADGSGGGDGSTTGGGQVSPDGNKILFTSDAGNLADGAGEATSSVYERNMATGVTRRVSASPYGVLGRYSPAGDTIAFLDDSELWLEDTRTGARTEVSAGLPGTTRSGYPAFSPDGTRVAFERTTIATYLRTDIFVHDRRAGTTRLATVGIGGTVSSDNSPTRVAGFHPTDPDRLLFWSRASNLVRNDDNPWEDVFVRNLRTGVTTLVSVDAGGAGPARGQNVQARWAGGGEVAFVSDAGDLGPTDTNDASDVFVRNLEAGTTRLVSTNAAGDDSGDRGSGRRDFLELGFEIYELSVSADGSRIAFGSDAGDLGPTDAPRPNRHDVYVASLVTPPSS